MDGVTSLSTTEALAHTTGWGNGERRGLIVVERTQSFVTCACTAKRDVVGNDVNNVGGIYDSVYGGLWNHKGEELGIRS